MTRTKTGTLCLLLVSLFWLTKPCTAQTAEKAKQQMPIAIVAGQPIYESDLLPQIQAQLLQLSNQEYELKGKALENLVQQKLLEAEAKAKGVTVETLLEREIETRADDITEAEITAYYLALKDKISRPFEEIKPQVREALRQAKAQQLRQDYLKRLREKSDVLLLLSPNRFNITPDPSRMLGSAQAPIMIVEFSEFQCPFCQKVQPTIKALLTKYQGQVSLSFRDFPLRQIHPLAQGAAEASRCAAEQGKFWQYHDLLFANPSKLDASNLTEHARTLGLDEARFSTCVASGKFKSKVEEDLQEMTKLGINGAPAFFINGIFISGAQSASVFEKVIESELLLKKFQQQGLSSGKN